MEKVLDKTSPAIRLAEDTLDILRDRKIILCYKVQERKNSNREVVDTYFKVMFGENISCFELRVALNKKESSITWNEGKNKILLSLYPETEYDYLVIARLLTEKVITQMNTNTSGIGFLEEDRFENALENLKIDGKIEDYYRPEEYYDNNEGKDFIVIFHQKEVPIQTLSSVVNQKEHALRFPKIPTLRLKNRSIKEMENLARKMVKKFEKNKVIHV